MCSKIIFDEVDFFSERYLLFLTNYVMNGPKILHEHIFIACSQGIRLFSDVCHDNSVLKIYFRIFANSLSSVVIYSTKGAEPHALKQELRGRQVKILCGG